ncbi:MAG: VWA domain-containing protein [Clostridia bacterium]|nr:VWA domain-containing protein [Clostridia bacterium]
MRRLLRAALAVMLIAAVFACAAQAADSPVHNTVLIIDNSRSTTGRHSLGGATDPGGLRFDAARLVYDNVLKSAETGHKGKIAVIVFCGSENCVSYGPMDIDADPAALDAAIGSGLTEAANRDKRDNYTDIRTAVQTARDMMAGFTGQTSVILLTDGVNDLTNVSDPFSRPENIEANDRTVSIIGEMRRMGADFSVIALTAGDAAKRSEDFMAFINRMAAASGGVEQADGSYGNVLMATQADLNSKLLQMLIKTESAGEASIQASEQAANEEWPFTVPYRGISDATVNITFMPEDKAGIDSIELIAPDGAALTVYGDGAAQPGGGISVTEARSYVMLSIAAPQPGEWRVIVSGTARSPINTVVRFNHNLKIRAELPADLHPGDTGAVKVWLDQYNGDHFEPIADSDIYRLSRAVLTVLSPAEDSRPVEIPLEDAGDCFAGEVAADAAADAAGLWFAEVSVRNDYWADRVNDLSFEVAPAPTPEPTKQPEAQASEATGSAGDSATFIDEYTAVIRTEQDGDSFFWQVSADPDAGTVSVSWTGNGVDDAVAELRAEGSDAPLITGIHSGDALDLSELPMEQEYGLMLTAFTDVGGATGESGEMPPMQKLELQIVPDIEQTGGAVLSVIDAVVKLAPSAMSSPENIQEAVEAVKAMQDSVSDLSQAVTDSGIGAGDLPGSIGASDGGAQTGGAEGAAEAPAETPAETPAEVPAEAPAEAPAEMPAEVPAEAPAPADSGVSGMLNTVLDSVRQNWMIAAGGAAALVVLLAAVLLRGRSGGKSGPKVKGHFKVVCDILNLEKVLQFEGPTRISSGSPLTKHPDIAKMKGSKPYDVLSHIQVGMVRTNARGEVPGCDTPQLPNEDVITLTYTDSRTGAQQVVCVGSMDAGTSVFQVYDAGRTFEVQFSGNLSMDELLSLQGRR